MPMLLLMDDLRIGSMLRAARVRRVWRQCDVAAAAAVSDQTVSRLERGHLDRIQLATIRAVAGVLEVSVELRARSRSTNLERSLNTRHAALAESVIRWIAGLPGWVVRPEVSFSVWGERGVVDLVAWHAGARALLLIELKTAIVDVGELLGTLGRKRRLTLEIARGLDWVPRVIGTCLIVAEGGSNRRRLVEHAATFRSALPDGRPGVRRWLAQPAGDLRATMFSSDRRLGSTRRGFASVSRVSTRRNAGLARPGSGV